MGLFFFFIFLNANSAGPSCDQQHVVSKAGPKTQISGSQHIT